MNNQKRKAMSDVIVWLRLIPPILFSVLFMLDTYQATSAKSLMTAANYQIAKTVAQYTVAGRTGEITAEANQILTRIVGNKASMSCSPALSSAGLSSNGEVVVQMEYTMKSGAGEVLTILDEQTVITNHIASEYNTGTDQFSTLGSVNSPAKCTVTITP